MPVYLGPNTPVSEIGAVVKMLKPDYAYTHLTVAHAGMDGKLFLKKLTEMLGDIPLLLSGPLLKRKRFPKIPQVRFLSSLGEVRDAVAEL